MISSEFGAFFRQIRKGLGLSLREFSRRNGFDQGNVSRLERGLMPLPKTDKALAEYAKALKLKPKSREFERFMSLAGRPTKPPRGHGHKNWVTAKHLEDWAGTVNARSTLPQLIRRLIRATCEGSIRVEAPAAEQIHRPGWDIMVDAAVETEFVPQGLTGWELGTDKDPKKKADTEFAKRKPNQDITFLFVTPRKYVKKAEWIEGKTKLKRWKEVLFYDSATLEEWLECAPAVDEWLARVLGLCPPGVVDVDEHWKNLQALTDPSLKADVYLASRSRQLGELKEWAAGPPSTLVIESRSPAEAVDFVVAASRQPELEEEFAARALIVEERDALRSLAGANAHLILIVNPTLAIEAELIAEAVRSGHHVIVCTGESPDSRHKRIKLDRVSSLDLRKALEAQGVERKKAENLVTNSGGSITVLKRRTARHPGTVQPEWSRRSHGREVVPFLLAGRWSDALDGDRRALSRLADTTYRDVVALAEHWSGPPEPMLTRGLSRWDVLSRDDSWTLVCHALNDEDLRRFQEVSLEVLGELDPACDLPSDQRWKASILGKVRTHSDILRTGLAESLALLGARPPDHEGLSFDSRRVADSVVRTLLNGKDWKAWASLSHELPLLAESAPDAFLTALEDDLSRKSPVVVNLFDPNSSPWFGSHHHTSLLFALEGLAWDRSSLSRVSQLLAQLYELAPTTKVGNNPMRTLEQVFMPWYPQTTATVDERVRILESLSKKHPKAGWRLLLELLPMPHSTVSTNYRPAFRNWALDWQEGASRAHRAFQVEACSHLLVELAGTDPGRLKEVIDAFENLPVSAQTKLLERITRIEVSQLTMDERRGLAETVREKVDRHRRFADSEWALKEAVLKELNRIRVHLQPEDVVARNAWLFDDYWKVRMRIDRQDQEEMDAVKALERLRATALAEVRSEKNWDGVLALLAAASADQVGWSVGISATIKEDVLVLPAMLTDTRKGIAEFANGYVRARLNQQDWLREIDVNQWSDDQLVQFALAIPPGPEAWDIVAKRGPDVEEQYWKKLQGFSHSKNATDVVRACAMFTKVGHPFMAAGQLGMARLQDIDIDPVIIVNVLDHGYDTLFDLDRQWIEHIQYDVGALIQHLQNLVETGDPRVDVNNVATLEWKYLALLDGHTTSPKVLHTWLEQKPEFLVQLLKIIFRRNDEPKADSQEPSDDERARAVQAYRLLNSWKRVPGSSPDGSSVNAELLRRWVKSVQELAESEARREVADIRIGEVFAYAPNEPDGAWPCIAVRDAIEEFCSEDLNNGFEVGIFNKRGAYNKAPDEGGSQERVVAKQYFDWAEASSIEWPKTAALLRRVGETYEAYARREDAEAESRRGRT
jgi:transcriptional regulator with XRE-family HTH domain